MAYKINLARPVISVLGGHVIIVMREEYIYMFCYLCFRWPCYYCDERGIYLHVLLSLFVGGPKTEITGHVDILLSNHNNNMAT
jgi:hypothetical protein